MGKVIMFILFVMFILRKIAEASRQQQMQNRPTPGQDVELSEEALQAFLKQRKPSQPGQTNAPPPSRAQFAPDARPQRTDEDVLDMFRSDTEPEPSQQPQALVSPPRPAPPPLPRTQPHPQVQQLPKFLQDIVGPVIEELQPKRPPVPPPTTQRRSEPRMKQRVEAKPKPAPQRRQAARQMARTNPLARLSRLSPMRQAIIHKEILGKPGGRSFEDYQ